MSNKKQQTFNRSDIELALRQEFPDLSKSQISLAIDSILESIVDAVALDEKAEICLLYTSPSPRDGLLPRMPSSA